MHPCCIAAESPRTGTVVEAVDRRLGFDLETEHLPLLDDGFVEWVIVAVQYDGRAEHLLGPSDAGDVIEVGVGQEHVANREAVLVHRFEEQIDVVSGVDYHALP